MFSSGLAGAGQDRAGKKNGTISETNTTTTTDGWHLVLFGTGDIFVWQPSLFSSSFFFSKLPSFFSYTIPTYYTHGGRKCKEGGERRGGYFNDVIDESEPIYMTMGWEGKEDTYWNWGGWIWLNGKGSWYEW
ncbi:hypothetical protein B0H65DRAFT_253138 [Neurospora tetraspora]|uniref:Uncharacterized protein n=1 Tax=Neurospora tetraspora TaxID=94610 RepID=A0AAE0JA75_9PEZI|nr:hypothetical protein B0H65DRAFT_253138 [Neurospora tetraspora]